MQKINHLDFGANAAASQTFLLEHGRIFSDVEKSALWFNWTCSGFSVRFTGSQLKARILALPQKLTAPVEVPEFMLYPQIGVYTDGSEMSWHQLEEGDQELVLFEGENAEHILTIRKLSENIKGKCALISLETNGTFLQMTESKPLHFEFVGDSITCGFGIDPEKFEEEHGENSYGFLTAQAFDAEYSAISVSGCAVSELVYAPNYENSGMASMYEFVDAPLERFYGKEPSVKWDFAAHPSDAVILNLGTNDMFDFTFQNYNQDAVLKFRKDYRAFIEMIRRLNGPEVLIVCTLGPMSYYYFDEIRDIVKEYAGEKKDERIVCFKYGEMNPMIEEMGFEGHPALVTHTRMAKELTAFLKGYFC